MSWPVHALCNKTREQSREGGILPGAGGSVLQGYGYSAAESLLKGGVKNSRELNNCIEVGRMYLLVLEASQV